MEEQTTYPKILFNTRCVMSLVTAVMGVNLRHDLQAEQLIINPENVPVLLHRI
jgi:hypothetical protein